ncbi:metallophosphoesterase family protein [Marmoricola sp. RAF53]|uniref:metallophosphoesterase family protein n=1 Tax=Marmoricola sp. RAF53 TaxID=3233059 RepID=UPI003F9CFCFA
MSLVALAGDWHGDLTWANARLQGLGEQGVRTLFHVGDFGIWPGPTGKRFLGTVEKVCAKYGLTVYVTLGNHEDWARMLQRQERLEERNELGPMIWLSDHVAVHPRDPAGHRFVFGGRSFVSLGGAPSVDFPTRSQGKDWWAEEMIPQATAEAVAAGGYADVMLTHDAPGKPWQCPKVRSICEGNPWGWTDRGLAWAALGQERLTTAFEGVRPRILFHGHFHVADSTKFTMPGVSYETRIVSLHRNQHAGNIALLNLETLEVW